MYTDLHLGVLNAESLSLAVGDTGFATALLRLLLVEVENIEAGIQ